MSDVAIDQGSKREIGEAGATASNFASGSPQPSAYGDNQPRWDRPKQVSAAVKAVSSLYWPGLWGGGLELD